MRSSLESADADQALWDVLSRVGPAAAHAYLREGPGLRVNVNGWSVPAPVAGTPGRYALPGTDLAADVSVEFSPQLGTAVQSVALVNVGEAESPPISEIDALFLPLEVTSADRPRACGFGGGLTHGFYPPRAYRPEEVCFGQARDWVPTSNSFTRWWTGKALYELRSEPTGLSSDRYLPLMLACWETGGGLVGLWAAMEWSGRWRMSMGCEMDWRYVFRAGPLVNGVVLAPGETLRLPPAHVGIFGGPGAELEDGLNSIRRCVGQALAPDVGGRRPGPILAYDHWFGIEERVCEPVLMKQVDRAAELGLEYFVVDAGWYDAAGGKFWEGIGNWERVDERKFPKGLEPLAEYVRLKGMGFGLWFEPERARAGSDWLEHHAEWFGPTPSATYGHLDLTMREARDGLIEMLSGWIERLDVRWLRWDYNQTPTPFWDQVDPTGKLQFAYFEGLYRVFDTLLERHPDLIIDNCAGGGRRIDFGTLRRSATMVISDHAEDPHVCRIMQTGGARVFPANYMNSSIYVGERDSEATTQPLDIISRMCGSITLCGHIANWSEQHTGIVKRLLDAYRSFRHLLMRDFHPLTAYPRSAADWDVVQFLDPDTREAVVLAYRMRGGTDERRVHPVRLAASKAYTVADPLSEAGPETVDGASLMAEGLHLQLEPDSAAVRHLIPFD